MLSSHSDLLWAKIRLAEGRLNAASDDFWTHPELAQLLPVFLVQLHRVMQGGLHLMRTARDRALTLPDDPVARIVAPYLDQHILEEQDHDDWLLDDIGTLGISPAEVAAATPVPAVVSLVGAQYFWALHIHPVTVFGYLIVLEGYPPLTEQLEAIRKRTRLPATAFRCLIAHADNDPHHIADLNRTLDSMPLTEEQQKYIALSAFHTIDAVASVFEELVALHATSPEIRLRSLRAS
ncbi:iron-containing redox enzyme family protein [Edaphobacter modestus]|uniref:Heme oxygenase-like protein n=1 Tax=Edaphobacter modestus TaxID=388466 RepID=A0A4Q7YSW5_9BACT|nr:iron-containing redox enzyme family protein [Edaphobacter modestus]RZU40063.1 heme oxygenase-like protein [Edaphobacter modestus]